MNRKAALLAVAGLLAVVALVAVDSEQRAHKRFAAQAAYDATFAQYHHIYAFTGGGADQWHAPTKNSGPITDLDGHPLPATVDATHPGCLDVFVAVEAGKRKGIAWTTEDGDSASISSSSLNIGVVACRDSVSEYEAGN